MARLLLIPSTLVLLTAGTLGASVPDGTWPESQGNVSYTEPYVVAAGEVFDGGMKTYDRSDITCEGQTESGSSTAVFKVEAGGTLKNVIIGTNQMEGVHCDDHDCTIENVWWEDVCEDALSIKGGDASSVSTVTGGGARYADDKVIQHNGYGSVVIDGFYAQEFGKLYRSCGTCGDRQRFVNVSNVYAVDPDVSIVTVNENYGDEAILKNIYISAEDDDYVICGWSEGTDGDEPTSLGDGISYPLCQYSDSDIHINEAVPSSSSSGSTTVSTSSGSSVAVSSTSSAEVDTDTASTTSSSSGSSSEISSAVTSSLESSEGSSNEASTSTSDTGSEASSNASSSFSSAVDDSVDSSSTETEIESSSSDASTTSSSSSASASAYDFESSSTSSNSASVAGDADTDASTTTSTTSTTAKCGVRRH